MNAPMARVILIRTQRLVKMKKKLNKMKKKSEISNLLKRKQTILVYLILVSAEKPVPSNECFKQVKVK